MPFMLTGARFAGIFSAGSLLYPSNHRAMDKFVIEGGYPLSGTVVPAGNKNAALPILAASLLTEEEVVVGNVPRIRDVDVDAGPARGPRRERRVARRARGRRCAPSSLTSTEVDAELASPHPRVVPARRARCWPAPARRACPPPGGDFIGRRRLDPHLDALRALGAQIDVDARLRDVGPEAGCAACDFFMDEASVMATENALMAAALTQGTTTIRNAASEPHVQDLARLLVAMGARIDGIGSNVLDRARAQPARRRPHVESRRTTSRSAASWRSPPSPAARCASRAPCPDDLKMIRMVFERLGLKSHHDGDDLIVPPEQRLRVQGRRRRRDPQDRRRPLAGVPGRPHQHRARGRDAGRGHRADPREDVREPAVLRRQADLHGRSDRALRSPPGDRAAVRAGFMASAWRAPTSGPAWRCSSRACAPRACPRSATSARSTAATSASTIGCASSARASSASGRPRVRSPYDAAQRRRGRRTA